MTELYVEDHGTGRPAIVLLHGMGATGAVWRRVVDELGARWSGRVVVVDLPGHGRSSPLPKYTYTSVAARIGRALAEDDVRLVVGHSFGGAIATTLASGRFDSRPAAALACGVKVTWSRDELDGAAAVAAKPPRVFATREEAEERYRRVSGLTVKVTDDARDLARGIVEVEGGWRLSQDPAIGAIGDPRMAAQIAVARRPIVLARGELDPMVCDDEIAALGHVPLVIRGAGHNAHVERPDEFARLIVEVTSSA